MNIFDKCNVKGLLAGYVLSAIGKDCPERTAELLALEAAIREHAIREASVGHVSIRKASEFGMIEFEELEVTRCDDVFAWTKYDLIPHKETT